MKKVLIVFVVLVISFIVGITFAADLTKGLVGYWPLDGNGNDSVGVTKGSDVGGAKWVQNGHLKGAIELDGSTGHVAITGFKLVSDTVTFVAWINGWKQSDWSGIVVSRGTSATWMGFGPNDTLTYVWNGDSPNTYNWVGAPPIPKEKWGMVAIAIAPDKATSFAYTDANGLQQGENKIPHIEETIDNVKFGWDECCGTDRHFKGLIDEVMIYERTLNKDEILQLATQGFAVKSLGKLTITWGSIKH